MARKSAEAVAPEAGADTSALTVSHVGVSFSGVRALDDVTFDFPVGGISAVIGPNGAGKTTLFNCISGIYRHEGSVTLHGTVLDRMRPERRASAGIARTFQTPILLNELSVLDNVMLGTYNWTTAGMLSGLVRFGRSARDERAARDAAHEILASVGLQGLTHRVVAGLAHADRRRVEVARALVARPRLLMLDEPAAGLSAGEADDLLALVAELAENADMTAILVEHDVGLVMRVARRVVVLDAGRLLAVGTPAEISADPAVIAAYLGDDIAEERG